MTRVNEQWLLGTLVVNLSVLHLVWVLSSGLLESLHFEQFCCAACLCEVLCSHLQGSVQSCAIHTHVEECCFVTCFQPLESLLDETVD